MCLLWNIYVALSASSRHVPAKRFSSHQIIMFTRIKKQKNTFIQFAVIRYIRCCREYQLVELKSFACPGGNFGRHRMRVNHENATKWEGMLCLSKFHIAAITQVVESIKCSHASEKSIKSTPSILQVCFDSQSFVWESLWRINNCILINTFSFDFVLFIIYRHGFFHGNHFDPMPLWRNFSFELCCVVWIQSSVHLIRLTDFMWLALKFSFDWQSINARGQFNSIRTLLVGSLRRVFG